MENMDEQSGGRPTLGYSSIQPHHWAQEFLAFPRSPHHPALACGLTSSWERWKKRAMSCTRSYLI